MNPFSLEHKSVLVTGASSGIGKAIAIQCAEFGADVIITGRNKDRLKDTLSLMKGQGHKLIPLDFNDKNQMDSFVDELPDLDGLVHSAGIVTTVPFSFISLEKIEKIFSVNLFAPATLTQKILKRKKIKSSSSIVWISSISGTECSIIGNSLYSSTKGGVDAMVKAMALELSPKKIRVNSINPGQIETNIMSEGVISEEQLELEKKKYPLKRFGSPEEVAYGAIYLLSDASSWVTGSRLKIDGGYTLQ